MSAAKHTKGPWVFTGTRSVNGRNEALVNVGEASGENYGNVIAIIHMGGEGAIYNTERQVAANARLIARAPELLAAVEDLQEKVNRLIFYAGGTGADHYARLIAEAKGTAS